MMTAPDSKLKINIITYNIHKGLNFVRTRFVLHHIKHALSLIEPDLLFLQEIQGEHSGRETRYKAWPDTTQFEFLADRLWPHYAYGKNAIYKSGHHGNAILSKYPFTGWENIDVSLQQRASRSILHGILQPANMSVPIHTICIHLGLLKSERLKQLETLCDRLESHVPHNEPLILAGDFNDWQQVAEQYLETHLDLREAFKLTSGEHAKTFPAWRPTLAVDRIYFRGLQLIDCECLDIHPWRWMSDHLPLFASFELKL